MCDAKVSNVKRRSFIAMCVGAASFLAIKPSHLFAEVSGTVGTAIALGQLAIGAAKLFQGSSTSSNDDVIIKMLANVSKQLHVITDGLEVVAQRIEEVRKIVIDLPDAVVQELTRAELRGATRGYSEILRTRQRYGKNKRDFLKEQSTSVRNLIENIKARRQVLAGYPSSINVPVMAAALSIEYGARRLIGDSEQAIASMAQAYAIYFETALYKKDDGLKDHISRIRQARFDKINTVGNPEFSVERVKGLEYGWWLVSFGVTYLKKTLVPFDAHSSELYTLALIESDERYVSLSRNAEWHSTGNRSISHICDRQPSNQAAPNCVHLTNFPMSKDWETQAEAARIKSEAEINSLTDQLYFAVSSYFAGLRALNFTQQFPRSP